MQERSATFKASLQSYELNMAEYGPTGHMTWLVAGLKEQAPGGTAAAGAKGKASKKTAKKGK